MKLFMHLNFGGNCEEAFRYYERALRGKVTMMLRVSDLPPDAPRSLGSSSAVIHARLAVAGVELIGNDVPPDHFKPARSAYLYLKADSAEHAEAFYAALADGGDVSMTLQETFFATRFAQLRDRFGILWTILHERPR